MPTTIKCPKCTNEFDIEEVLYSEVQLKLEKENQKKLNESLKLVEEERSRLNEDKKKLEETKKKENEIFLQKVDQERLKIQKEERNKALKENEVQLSFYKQKTEDAEFKIKSLKEKELEVLQLKNEISDIKRDLEVEKNKYLEENKQMIIEEVQLQEKAKHEIEKKSWEIQKDQQNKLIDDLKRKAEQGSMQLQGETSELILEDFLKNNFPRDLIEEVGKGIEGADCILIVRNAEGMECGKIIFESKRTKAWNNTWIDKLKSDQRKKQALFAILVSQVYPKGMECFGEKDGIWIASFKEVIHLTRALRNGIIQFAEARKSDENKGEKMQMLYNYLTGTEFRQHIEAIVEGFLAMRSSINKERIQMEKLWKEREKQIDKVLENTSGMYGSIKGLAGSSIKEIPSLELPDEEETEVS